MKKFLLLFMSAFMCTAMYAEDIDLFPARDNSETGGNRTSILYPSASYEDGTITIYAPYYIDGMMVVIAGSNENEIYSVQLGDFRGKQSFVLPDEVDVDKYSIYLYFNDICLFGLF